MKAFVITCTILFGIAVLMCLASDLARENSDYALQQQQRLMRNLQQSGD